MALACDVIPYKSVVGIDHDLRGQAASPRFGRYLTLLPIVLVLVLVLVLAFIAKG
jgi:hypothetical protein